MQRGRGDPKLPSFRGVRSTPWNPPIEGRSSTSSFPLRNQQGDSRAERENDVHNGDCVTGRIRGRGRVAASSVILAKRGSPRQGQGGTLSLPRWNQPGDSSVASLPQNDSIFSASLSLPSATNRGILRLLTQALNDVHKYKCAAGCGSSVDAEAQTLRHSEAAGRGIP